VTDALGAYTAFVRAKFHEMLAYRLRYYTGIVSYLVYVSTYFFLWRAVYANRADGESLHGFDLDSLVTYVAIGWLARSFFFNNVDREIADLIIEGKIALILARPVSFQGLLVAGAIGESLFRLLFFSIPIAVVLFLVYPIQGPASPAAGGLFLVSTALALLVFVHINFLVGLAALELKSIQGVMRAKHYLVELLSGLLLPITFFPEWLQTVTRWLPFQAVAYVPASIYLGRFEGAEIGSALAGQAAWAVLLAALSAFTWSRASRRLTVQGG